MPPDQQSLFQPTIDKSVFNRQQPIDLNKWKKEIEKTKNFDPLKVRTKIILKKSYTFFNFFKDVVCHHWAKDFILSVANLNRKTRIISSKHFYLDFNQRIKVTVFFRK